MLTTIITPNLGFQNLDYTRVVSHCSRVDRKPSGGFKLGAAERFKARGCQGVYIRGLKAINVFFGYDHELVVLGGGFVVVADSTAARLPLERLGDWLRNTNGP